MNRDAAKLGETLRSRWFAICLHTALWLVVLLVVLGSGLSGRAPQFSEAKPDPANVSVPVPVAKMKVLFASGTSPKPADPATNLSLFATTYFVPRTPPPAPPPVVAPPPTTWKVELTYQGFYSAGGGPRHAIIRVGEKLVTFPVGSMVVTNLFIVEAGVTTLTLTNTAVQTNVLALNAKQAVEVPLK